MRDLAYLTVAWQFYWFKLDKARREEGAVSTETAIITAILAGLALAIGAIIVSKVTAKANSIPTDSATP